MEKQDAAQEGRIAAEGREPGQGGQAVGDQYSLGSSSVVTLRSHSVMIQSFRSGATW